MAVGATKAVARPKRGAAEGSTVPKSRLIKEEIKEKTQPYRAESFAIHRWCPLFPFRTCSIPTPYFSFFSAVRVPKLLRRMGMDGDYLFAVELTNLHVSTYFFSIVFSATETRTLPAP